MSADIIQLSHFKKTVQKKNIVPTLFERKKDISANSYAVDANTLARALLLISDVYDFAGDMQPTLRQQKRVKHNSRQEWY